MKYSDEELENYLKLWENSKEEVITEKRDLLLALITEVLICREQAIEEVEVSLFRCLAN